MGRFPDDQDPYDIPLQPEAYDAVAEGEDDDELGYDDTRVPVLDDIVTPGPGITPLETIPPLELPQTERLHGLVHEAVNLALDDALDDVLDTLRGELHARLREHLDERLPQLIAEVLRDTKDG
ncbi:MAG: hypothetical protein DRR03_04225 [Gammaproteobacteria bacterium]|nr:MAG: hypothetical protein DRR03_04225 [Gammaproteobacteria bacterium]